MSANQRGGILLKGERKQVLCLFVLHIISREISCVCVCLCDCDKGRTLPLMTLFAGLTLKGSCAILILSLSLWSVWADALLLLQSSYLLEESGDK